MVDRDLIEEIIIKTIQSKCYRNKISVSNSKYQIRLNKNVRRELNNFTEKVKGANKEYLLILDKNGNTVFEKEGNTDGVSISISDEEDEYLNTLKLIPVDNNFGKGDYIVIHNHPVHNPDSLDSEDSYKNILSPCFSGSDILTFRSQDFCKTSIVVSSDNGKKMLLTKTDDVFDSFVERGNISESELWGNMFGNPFRIQDQYFEYLDKLHDTTKKIIDNDVDNSILRNIVNQGYSTPNDIINEYERRGMKDIGSLEDYFTDLRIFCNDNGFDLSIEE